MNSTYKLASFFCLTISFWLNLLAAPSTDTRPHICLVIVDDLRPFLGCYGNKIAHTPHIDQLASEGTLFSHAFVQYPICGPSRASLMTGIRPGTSGFMSNEVSFEGAFHSTLSLNRYFKTVGYQVFGAGKVYHDGPGIRTDWSAPFFETRWLDHVLPANKAIAEVFFTPQNKGLPPSVENAPVSDEGYDDGKVTLATINAISTGIQSPNPFLMVSGFRKPHLPFTAPKKYWDLYDRSAIPRASNPHFPQGAPPAALKYYGELWDYSDTPPSGQPLSEAQERRSLHGYYACISYVDAQIGLLIQALKDKKIYKKTAIVLIGDNGYQNGNNGTWAKGVNWESTNHVPLIMKIPGKGKAGQQCSQLVEALDLYPTLCALVGSPTPPHCEGKNLIPLILDPTKKGAEVACSQFINGDAMGRSIRTNRYRYTLWSIENKNVGVELYDLEKDPEGNINQAKNAEYREAVEKCQRLFTQYWPKEKA